MTSTVLPVDGPGFKEKVHVKQTSKTDITPAMAFRNKMTVSGAASSNSASTRAIIEPQGMASTDCLIPLYIYLGSQCVDLA